MPHTVPSSTLGRCGCAAAPPDDEPVRDFANGDVVTTRAMNPAFHEIIAAPADDRRALFLTTAGRLGTAFQLVEKDFWVTWTLDALFNGLPADGPRLLFKGGTSLSKAYGLIERFSEDVDITVFRADIGQGASAEELEQLGGKARQRRLDAIKAACQQYINGPLLAQLSELISAVVARAGIAPERAQLDLDTNDPDRQTLLFTYPSVASAAHVYDGYVRSAVKIESGAKSAVDPHRAVTVAPYVMPDVAALDLRIPNVLTVAPERTFWDKIVILHGLRAWFERRGVLRQGGQRVSRHYYDASRLARSAALQHALVDRALAAACARHARLFFPGVDLDLTRAVPGTLAITPTAAMLDPLRRDYEAMTGMIFGQVPPFDEVMSAVSDLERRINA